MINPGRFNRRVTFLRKQPGKDAYGDPVNAWTEVKTVWAAIAPVLGKEFFAALTESSRVEVKISCRYFAGVDSEMRIRHGSDVYNITAVIDVNDRHEEILCYCRRVRDD